MKMKKIAILTVFLIWSQVKAKDSTLRDDGLMGLTNINKILSLLGTTHPCKTQLVSSAVINFIKLEEMENFQMNVEGNQFKASFEVDGHAIVTEGQIDYNSPPGTVHINIQKAETDNWLALDVKDELLDAITELNHKRVKVEEEKIIISL